MPSLEHHCLVNEASDARLRTPVIIIIIIMIIIIITHSARRKQEFQGHAIDVIDINVFRNMSL